jgi:predicted RNase H-like HicB family nuclease
MGWASKVGRRRPPKQSLHQNGADGIGSASGGELARTVGRWSDRGTSDIVRSKRGLNMKHFTAVIERDADTGLYVGWVPGFAGAHSQGATLDELQTNLQEVIEMLLEEGDPHLESVFIGTQAVEVA